MYIKLFLLKPYFIYISYFNCYVLNGVDGYVPRYGFFAVWRHCGKETESGRGKMI